MDLNSLIANHIKTMNDIARTAQRSPCRRRGASTSGVREDTLPNPRWTGEHIRALRLKAAGHKMRLTERKGSAAADEIRAINGFLDEFFSDVLWADAQAEAHND